MSPVDSIDKCLVFVHIQLLCLGCKFNPYKFTVIIKKYDSFTILLIILGSFLEVFFFSCVSNLEKFL